MAFGVRLLALIVGIIRLDVGVHGRPRLDVIMDHPSVMTVCPHYVCYNRELTLRCRRATL